MLIEKKIATTALASLAGHGFERDSQRTVCSDFAKQLAHAVEQLCKPLAQPFAARMALTRGKERQDVFSKAVGDLTELWMMTIARFRDHIALQEAIDLGAGKIPCEKAVMHLPSLHMAWQEAEIAFDAQKQIKPKSPKANRKRSEAVKKDTWVPWPFKIRA